MSFGKDKTRNDRGLDIAERKNDGGRSEQRVPLHKRNVLVADGYENDKDHHYCWVVDSEGNLERFMSAWYEFTPATEGTKIDDHFDPRGGREESVVCKKFNGITHYLMRLKQEYYEQDLKAKRNARNAQFDQMKGEWRKQGDGNYGDIKVSEDSKL